MLKRDLEILKHSASPKVGSKRHCFISDVYLAYCKSKDFFKVSRLTYKEQIEGPASAKVCHNDCINWHWSEKSFPGSTKFLGKTKQRQQQQRHFWVCRRQNEEISIFYYQDYPLYFIQFTIYNKWIKGYVLN